jgi:ABC-2 type transport system ATP-binding protein
MINIKNLHFGYTKNKELFSDLNLQLQKGKIYGLLGKNGSGKTSLIKQMTGLLFPDKGSIEVLGQNPQNRSPQFLASYYLIPEEFETSNISLKTFLKITAVFYPDFNEDQFMKYLTEFKINLSLKLNELSYGQKKKVLLSFGLATNTPILMMDEPTNGLDIPSKSIFRRLMASALTEKRTFIISTHQVKDIEGIIDSIVILNQGKIIFNESLERISQLLSFGNLTSLDNNVLYAEKHFNSYEAISLSRKDDEASRINLELLFNAIIEPDSKLIQLFDNAKTEKI